MLLLQQIEELLAQSKEARERGDDEMADDYAERAASIGQEIDDDHLRLMEFLSNEQQ